MRFVTKAIIYLAMWLVAIFPFQIILDFVFQIKYEYPNLNSILMLSGWYWITALLPYGILVFITVCDYILGYWWSDLFDWFKPSTYDDYTFGGRLMRAFLKILGNIIMVVIGGMMFLSVFSTSSAQYLICFLTGLFTFLFDIKYIGLSNDED